MLKFLSGVTTGWVAARMLPPKPPETSPIAPPTMTDLGILYKYFSHTLEQIKDKLNEMDDQTKH